MGTWRRRRRREHAHDRLGGKLVVQSGRRGHGGGRSAGVCWPDHEEETPHDAHASFGRRRGRSGPSTPCRRRCRAARGRQGRAAELVAGALDQPGAAARAREEPRRGRGDGAPRPGLDGGSGEGERRGDLPLRGRDDRPEGGARARARSASAPPAGAADVPFEVLAPLPREGRFQGFSPDDVDLPGDARPLRERRSGERRPGRVEGPPRPHEGAATTTAATCAG